MASSNSLLRRKLARASWVAPQEGNVYGRLTVDATQALAYIAEVRRLTGVRVTLTHLVGKALGLAIAREPLINGRIVLGRFRPYPNVAIGFLAAVADGDNLANAKVEDIDKKPITDIANELSSTTGRLREGKDATFNAGMRMVSLVPDWLVRPIVGLVGFMTSGLGIHLPALGLEAFPFGACVVSNIGPLGLDEAYIPLISWTRVPIFVALGAVHERLVPIDGKPVVRPEFVITATIDHRFIDGAQAAKWSRYIKGLLEDPWQMDREAEGIPPEAGIQTAAGIQAEAGIQTTQDADQAAIL